MRVIDGAMGEGGGQVLRTALALSLATGEAVELKNIRAGRRRPGLMRQHLCAVKLAAQIGDAEVTGAEPGSQTLSFHPRALKTGHFEISVGTAGSATLVLQTVLPALLTATGTTTLLLEGGTHNPLAPPFDFLRDAFVPQINKLGPKISVELVRPGFFPAGGGQLRVTVKPAAKLSPLVLLERGAILKKSASATVAGLSNRIAWRELKALGTTLNWTDDQLRVEELPPEYGPGNVLHATIESEHVTEVFTGFGEPGVPAERIGERVAKEVLAYLAAGVPVGPMLADQLLLPIALAAKGSFRTQALTRHARTQLLLLHEWMGVDFRVEQGEGVATVSL
jgi:RNA 3'-terminal phosphate cyclase (ATP)